MNHSTWLEYRWNASACGRVRLHWRPLRVRLHSSFQQSTMGNWELLHHLAVLVCFVAESWPVSLLSLPPSFSLCLHLHFLLLTLFALFYTAMTKHAKVKLYYITDASPTLVLLPPLGWKSRGDRRFTLRSCITPSYLGQWRMFMLVNTVMMLSDVTPHTERREAQRNEDINGGLLLL